jgi:predicted outer membrane repeat protein
MQHKSIGGFIALVVCILATTFAAARAAVAQPSVLTTDAVVQPPCDEAAFDTALAAVQATSGGTITFNCGTATIVFTSQKLISKDVTIQGANQITLSGGNSTMLFYVKPEGKLTLHDITLTNGYTLSDGGAIYNNGQLELANVTIRDSSTSSPFSGGAIASTKWLTITNSFLENNTAGNGGALFLRFETSSAVIDSSILRNNRTTNTTNGWGGAILLWGGDVTLHGSRLEGNQARTGGGIHNAFATAAIRLDQGTVISGNTASSSNGGGIYSTSGSLTLDDVALGHNSAAVGGGGLFIGDTASLTLTNATLSDNTASSYAGGIHLDGSAVLTNVILDHNSAPYAGGIDNNGTAVLTLDHVTLTNNSATHDSGGLGNEGRATLTNVTLSGNSTGGEGGGIDSFGPITLTNVTLSGNSAAFGGGMMDYDAASLTNVTFSGNTASNYGGGVYLSAASLLHTLHEGSDRPVSGGLADGVQRVNLTAAVMLTNATLYDNTALGGDSIYRFHGAITLKNVILRSTHGMNCADQVDYFTGIVSAGFNLSSDTSCGLSQVSDQSNLDPRLKPLANNGGFTLTHLPRVGSPVIDAGQCEAGTDQRGKSRPVGAACDIGAVEWRVQDGFAIYLPSVIR